MNFKLDLAGQLTIENDTPFANLEFKGYEINIQIKENLI